MAIGVVKMHVEGLQSLEHRQADTPRRYGTHMHAFDVIATGDAVGDVPAAFDYPLVGRDIVANQTEDHHDHMLGDGDGIAIGDLGDGNAAVDGRLEVDVIGADAAVSASFSFGALPMRSAVR